MADTAVARRYAKALLALGEEQGNLDTLAGDLDRFAQLLGAYDGQLLRALCHPSVSPEERRAVLEAVLKRLRLDRTVGNFLRLVLDKGRAALLPTIAVEVRSMADVRAGRVRATLVTAAPISTELQNEFRAALAASTGKMVMLEARIDGDLIGGIVLQVGDKVYDASVRTRLDQLRHKLITQTPAEA